MHCAKTSYERCVPLSRRSPTLSLSASRSDPLHAVQRVHGARAGAKPAEDVPQLLVGVVAVDVGAREQLAAAQQSAVAGEQDALLGGGSGGEGGVADVLVLVRGVHAEQAQAAGERAEVDVEEEAQRGALDLLRALDAEDLHVLPGLRHVRDGHLVPVDEEAADLGERDAGRFDDVAEAGGAVGGGRYAVGAPAGRREQA